MTPTISTYTGQKINPLDLKVEEVRIEDIAHALSLCNRFAGHTSQPISVAQHSVYAAELCCVYLSHLSRPDNDHKLALRAILHDASEAYLGDVTKWLKGTPEMAGYREAEARIQKVIYSRFGLEGDDEEEVKLADRLLVRYEGLKGFGPHWKVLGHNPEAGSLYADLTPEEIYFLDRLFGGWEFWGWRKAEQNFLGYFRYFHSNL
jgi:hypothetical protein